MPYVNNGVIVDGTSNWSDFMTVSGGSTWAGTSGSNLIAFNSYTASSGTFGTSTATHIDMTTSQSPVASFKVADLRFNTGGVTLTLSGTNDIDAAGILVTPNASSGVTINGTGSLYGNGGAARLAVFDYGNLTVSARS